MSKGPVESKIPVFSRKPISARISRPFATLSNRVLAHLTPVEKSSDKRPGSPSSVIFGILNAGSGARKSRSDSVCSGEFSNASESSHIKASDVGKRVTLNASCDKAGILQFVGTTQFGGGIWCGVELDVPDGLNDGSVGNTRYFTCKTHHGIFAPIEKVKLIKSLNDVRVESEPLSLEDIERSAENDVLDHVALKSNMTLDFSLNKSNTSENVATPEGLCQQDWTLGPLQPSSVGNLVAKQQNLCNLSLGISKHNSLDLDESLGILTPDQMTDFTMTDESFHRTLSCEGMPNFIPEFKADVSSSSLKISDHLLSDATNMESTPVEDITMNGIMEFDDCLSSKSEFLPMNRDLAGSLETSSSYYIEHEKNNQSGMNCLVERTPSLEDLPMDGITTQDNNNSSEGPSNSTCSTQLIPNPNSFITSVTSIASLDNGYQGDGELSRPTSRGADHSPTNHQNVKKAIDSMTDSDFFTESDADVHEDLGRGDRRAQVIDGIIYGGALPSQSPNSQRRKSGTHSQIMEEMESSGVYSDLERKIEDQLESTLKPLVENVDNKMESCDDHPIAITELIHDTSPSEASTNMDETGASTETLQNPSSPDLKKNEPKGVKKSKSDISNKKFKMPNRNVTSKVKSMISSSQPIRKTSEDENQENRKPRPNKKGKWDAVMDKIAQGQTEKKTQPRIKEVKSKVFTQLTVTGSDSTPVTKRSNQKEFPLTHSTSTRSLRETTETKAKKRTRVRSSDLSTQSAGPGRSHPSQNSSRNSSITDLSEQNSAKISSSSSCSTYARSIKKQNGGGATGAISSPVSDETSAGKLTLPRLKEAITSRSTSSINSIQNKASTKDGKSNTKTNAIRKQLIRPLREHNRIGPPVTTAQRVKSETNNNASNQNNNVQTRVRTTTSTVETRTTTTGPSSGGGPAPTQPDLVPRLRHAVTVVDALGVLVQYLTVNLDAFSTPGLKLEIDRMRQEWLQSKENLAQAEAAYKELKENLTVQSQRYEEDIHSLRLSHQETLQSLETNHSEELLQLTRSHEEEKSSLQKKLLQETEQLTAQTREEILNLERKHLEEYESLKMDLKNKLTSTEKEAESRLSKLMEDYNKTMGEMKTRISQLESEKETLSMQYNALRQTDLKNPNSKLTHEVESLHHVLDLRNKDISELRMQNAFLAQDVEDLPTIRTKVTAQQTRIEDLTIQLERKSEIEQDLLSENRSFKEYYRTESAKVQTLQRQNEELQWALKQKSEALNVLAHSTPKKMPTCNHGKKMAEMSERQKSQEDSLSAPTSPKVLGVVEKSDSVSWVVDLEDAPEIVSKYLRRTNSFRQSPRRPTSTKSSSPRPSPSPADRERVRSVSVPVDTSADKENLWEVEMSRSADNSLEEGDFDTFDMNLDSNKTCDTFYDKSTFSLDLQPSDIIGFGEEEDKSKPIAMEDDEELLGMDIVGVVPKDAAGEAMISSGEDTSSSCSHSEDDSSSSEGDDRLLSNGSSPVHNNNSDEIKCREDTKCSLNIHSLLPTNKMCTNDDKLIQNFSNEYHASKQVEHGP
uniref:CAP-Gly domain-containing linker protein 1 n=2 Tax=Cacopsylla melanoneura TaxID=428564 RepID=A0A8D8QNR4_9HEMI